MMYCVTREMIYIAVNIIIRRVRKMCVVMGTDETSRMPTVNENSKDRFSAN